MKEFILLFRQPSYDYSSVTPKEMQTLSQKWKDWTGSIEAKGKLSGTGPRLSTEGRVLKPGGVITDGPFVEISEKLGGFMIIKARDIEEATTIAHGCPALESNGSVEIRPIYE